jgi:hypothetical protein
MRLKRRLSLYLALAVVVSSLAPILVHNARAAYLTDTYVRLDRLKASTATNFRVVFKTSAVNGTENKLRIKFYNTANPADFTVNTTQTVSSASCATETGATALPGTLAAAGDNTAGVKTVTISGTSDLATSTRYCVDLTSTTAVTNPASGNYIATVSTATSADALIDYRDVGLQIITDDQIVVTAVVPPLFSFALSGNTDAFTTNLDPAAVVGTTGRTITITTNAAKGWIAWVKDSNQGLSSASAPYTLPTAGTVNGSPTILSAGTEGYVLDVDLTTDAASGGTVTVDPEYNGLSSADGGTLSGTFQKIASSGGTANGDVLTMIEKAAIAGATPAGDDYTDTLTVVAAGNF